MSMAKGYPLDMASYAFVTVTLARFNSWDQFYFTFFKTFAFFRG